MAAAASEKFAFQAETKQLLHLVVHSLYTNKEVFLRELISNASDALDKFRLESLTNEDIAADGHEPEIRLDADGQARTLTVSDNGIGMSRDEVIENLGTIAKSGTRELLGKLKEAKKSDLPELIGQFGVGFYSAFMVADSVEVVTRKVGEPGATLWKSTGGEDFEIGDGERENHGTTIKLHLKPADDEDAMADFTEEWTIERIVKRYSDFVRYPVKMQVEREEKKEDSEESIKTIEDRTLNSMKPIWTRPASEVTEEEYTEFYKHVTHDWTEPLHHERFKAEGTREYEALLFVPGRAPFDLYYPNAEFGLQLYAKRVLILEKTDDLLPRYMRFIRGVIDASDLPLNVSREMLQESRDVRAIRRWLTKKSIDMLGSLQRKDEGKYRKLWHEFGAALKEGVGSDWENKGKLAKLLLFPSSNDPEKLTTLHDYVTRMKAGQEEIYYITGESREVLENAPQLEAFREKGYEVLYMTDPVDELMVGSLTDFEEKKLKSVGKGDVELGTDEEKKEAEEKLKGKKESYSSLLDAVKGRLDEHVKEVRLSKRLTASPACLASDETDMSPQMERLMRMSDKTAPTVKRILELNPDHDIVKKLQERFEANKEDDAVANFSHLLFDYALLAEGSPLRDPVGFNKRLAELMVQTI